MTLTRSLLMLIALHMHKLTDRGGGQRVTISTRHILVCVQCTAITMYPEALGMCSSTVNNIQKTNKNSFILVSVIIL